MVFKIIDNDDERCREFCTTQGLYADGIATFIGLDMDGKIVACSGYDYYNVTSIQQHICITPGVNVPRVFWWFIAYYPFEQLGVDMLIGVTPSTNKRALNLARRYGYVEQHRIVGGVQGGDLVIQTLMKKNCKWLNVRVNHGR